MHNVYGKVQVIEKVYQVLSGDDTWWLHASHYRKGHEVGYRPKKSI